MRILSIDPGSSLGWATDATGRLEWGTEDFHIKNGESSGNRWRRFGEWLKEASLHHNYRGDPITYDKPEIDLIVYERAHFMPRARAAAEIAAGFTTRLEEHCERHGIALQPVAVQTLKAFALPKVKRPKRLKGEGLSMYRSRCPPMDRSKEAMIDAAFKKLVAEGWPEGKLTTIKTLDEHAADALHLFWWAKENCK